MRCDVNDSQRLQLIIYNRLLLLKFLDVQTSTHHLNLHLLYVATHPRFQSMTSSIILSI